MIETDRAYTAAELEALGLTRADTLSVQRQRTRKTGKQHGPKWLEAGGRILCSGAAILEWLRGPGAETLRGAEVA